MNIDEPEPPLAITTGDAAASMSMADVNLMEKGAKKKPKNTPDAKESDGVFKEEDYEITEKKKKSRSTLWICVGAVLILVVSLGLGLGLGLKKEGSNEIASKTFSQRAPNAPNKRGSTADTSQQTSEAPEEQGPTADEQETSPPRRPNFDEIVAYLSDGVSDNSDLLRSGSPQNLAASWLATEDNAALSLPEHSGWDYATDRDAYMYIFRYVMALNYFALDGPNWVATMSFLSGGDVCTWNGVSLGVDNTFVGFELGGVICDEEGLPIALDLEYNDLSGEIPKENGLLGSLLTLDLDHNNIQGELPKALCDLVDLELLLIESNNLDGELPSCISNWKNLRLLKLDNNALSGELPSGICSLADLEVLVLDKNLFSGTLPSCFSDLKSSQLISFSDNKFEGNLPDLSMMSNLTQLFLDGNSFRGNPSDSLDGLENLQLLYLEDNEFAGNIHDFAHDMPNLMALDLSHNKFTSKKEGDTSYEKYGIPTHFFELEKLEILDLSNNLLEGELPGDIPVQTNLIFFSIHENKMTGPIPSGLKNLINLGHLDLANNNLSGSMPSEIFEMPSLNQLFLSENPGLAGGPIPAELQTMTQLRELSLKNTNRSGPLPELLNFNSLFLLDLDKNSFEGSVPKSYESLTNLRYLLLNRNPLLDGSLPVLNELVNMNTLLVDGTNIKGNFSSVCNLPAFTGEYEFPTETVAIADCSDDFAGIDCDCCHCCAKNDETCSDLTVASLDWDWENGFKRTSRDFGINVELADPPKARQP